MLSSPPRGQRELEADARGHRFLHLRYGEEYAPTAARSRARMFHDYHPWMDPGTGWIGRWAWQVVNGRMQLRQTEPNNVYLHVYEVNEIGELVDAGPDPRVRQYAPVGN